eukprot:CAMPEP_0178843694 /NCGR_PEP_ID=MMETSP0746-20121128/16315_1 /TAXON_ID=913974 /ORGANISM="Nitzschia punctata, Strain CCMP561" /LENGTH=51 /DNA_ID=CAMNT_0020507389 /DNA_START=126 /DNA_END=281 /DNA_ORIENTATION=-
MSSEVEGKREPGTTNLKVIAVWVMREWALALLGTKDGNFVKLSMDMFDESI